MNHGLENEKLPDFKVLHLGWGCGSVVLNLPSMYRVLGWDSEEGGGKRERGDIGGGSLLLERAVPVFFWGKGQVLPCSTAS